MRDSKIAIFLVGEMNNKIIGLAFLAACFCCSSVSMAAEGEDSGPNWKEETLTGDWSGLRSRLFDSGVDLRFTHKSDVFSNVSGGLKRGTTWMGHTETRVELDLEKLLEWGATTAYIHYHSDLGSKFNRDHVGSITGIDNIEVATNTAQFYQAWIQKNWFDDRFSVLAGLYAIDSEFNATDSSDLFLAPPYGVSNEIAQTGHNGPPIFPTGALAVRVKYTTADNQFYAMGAVADGVPGDPENARGTHIKLEDGDGTLSIVEFGYTPPARATDPSSQKGQEDGEIFNKTAIGFWNHSSHFDDVDPAEARKHRSQGAYIVAERTLYLERGQPSQGLSGFLRFGTASERTNHLDWTASLGLRYRGLIAERGEDIAGIAVTLNHAGDRYRSANSGDSSEISLEMTYRGQIRTWLALQPTVQYIVNPSMDPALRNASVIGLRAEVDF